jgi:hypothetical protein
MDSSSCWDIMLCNPLKVKRQLAGKYLLYLLTASCWFLAWLILQPWRCRHVPPKRRLTFSWLLVIISQTTKIFIAAAARTANPKRILYSYTSNCKNWSSHHTCEAGLLYILTGEYLVMRRESNRRIKRITLMSNFIISALHQVSLDGWIKGDQTWRTFGTHMGNSNFCRKTSTEDITWKTYRYIVR